MKKFFIYLFKGHTDDDLNSYMSQMSQHALRYERIIDDLRNDIKSIKEDNHYLRDLLFKSKGIIPDETIQSQTKQLHEPISLSRPSWPRVKAQLEREDREKLAAKRQADQTEEYWLKKTEESLQEEVKSYESES